MGRGRSEDLVPLRVLVVDDHEAVLRTTSRYLRRQGHTVSAVSTSEQAAAAAGPFDVGVFDLQLGDESGAELAADLLGRALVGGVVFHTGNPHSPAGDWARHVGPVVTKGEGLETLEQAVRDMGAASSSSSAPPSV